MHLEKGNIFFFIFHMLYDKYIVLRKIYYVIFIFSNISQTHTHTHTHIIVFACTNCHTCSRYDRLSIIIHRLFSTISSPDIVVITT